MVREVKETDLIPLPDEERKVRVSQRTAVLRSTAYAAKNLARYIKKLEELAMGVLVMESDEEGKPSVYAKPPDRAALEYLVDRVMGKAPQHFEVTGEDGTPVQFVPWLRRRDADDDIVEGEIVGQEVEEEPEGAAGE